jgi:ElaB/YqjD/DUF883 family membrane-anchored ribosome-binding protein
METWKKRMGIGSPEKNATDTYEREMSIVPDCISATENEIPVRQYNIAVLRNLLRFERAEGRLQVTNKRVIFRAAGSSLRGRTTLQQEFAMDAIAGIEAKNNYKYNFLFLIFALILLLPTYNTMFIGNNMPDISNSTSVRQAHEAHQRAVSVRAGAETFLQNSPATLKQAQERLTTAERDAIDGIPSTRRVRTGQDWWGNPRYETQRFRDKSESAMATAQSVMQSAKDEVERIEVEIERVTNSMQTLKSEEAEALRKKNNAIQTWKVMMTIWGMILGIGGAMPFFTVYKKFGLKLFLLNFSIYGFLISREVSGADIFSILLYISCAITIICVFIFCFRPNLVISIINKAGIAAAIDIRRSTEFTMYLEKCIGFMEVIPTDESESAIRELGAIINDVQKLGDLGLEKWKTPEA